MSDAQINKFFLVHILLFCVAPLFATNAIASEIQLSHSLYYDADTHIFADQESNLEWMAIDVKTLTDVTPLSDEVFQLTAIINKKAYGGFNDWGLPYCVDMVDFIRKTKNLSSIQKKAGAIISSPLYKSSDDDFWCVHENNLHLLHDNLLSYWYMTVEEAKKSGRSSANMRLVRKPDTYDNFFEK